MYVIWTLVWLIVVDVVPMLERMSRRMRIGMSSRPQHPRAQAPAPVLQEHGHGGPSIMERFKRMAPPSFKRESQPLLAESWMREIEKNFHAIRCAEEDKVSFGHLYVVGESLCVFEDGAVEVAWDDFMRLFRAKFILEHIQDKMEHEFLTLTQGSMAVLEYEARFAELSKYAPHIVADEHRKAKKFVMGLNPSLRSRLVAFDHRTLDEAHSTACRQESEMEQYLEEKKASQKRSAPPFQRQDRKKVAYQSPQRPVAVSSQQAVAPQSPGVRPSSKKECPHCGRTHGGSPAWSASPSSGSSSSTSDRKTRKASSPSSSVR
ncbi:hypothetical protein Taro_044709, partial [Colocasia esculenta]|nr:hypothetical protein [Colocasia esculenta]